MRTVRIKNQCPTCGAYTSHSVVMEPGKPVLLWCDHCKIPRTANDTEMAVIRTRLVE